MISRIVMAPLNCIIHSSLNGELATDEPTLAGMPDQWLACVWLRWVDSDC